MLQSHSIYYKIYRFGWCKQAVWRARVGRTIQSAGVIVTVAFGLAEKEMGGGQNSRNWGRVLGCRRLHWGDDTFRGQGTTHGLPHPDADHGIIQSTSIHNRACLDNQWFGAAAIVCELKRIRAAIQRCNSRRENTRLELCHRNLQRSKGTT
jgi:hypothetical protein